MGLLGKIVTAGTLVGGAMLGKKLMQNKEDKKESKRKAEKQETQEKDRIYYEQEKERNQLALAREKERMKLEHDLKMQEMEYRNSMAFNQNVMMAGVALGGQANVQTPPPIPIVAYNVAKDGKSIGPFDLQKLSTMAANGEIDANTLVWKQGMANWERAGNTAELAGLFPPPIK